ncbi:hypothetical protein N7495_006997 [Penicillium taxi]|uniref:uncharacterized protein n=1 Tax=Penicillium taxi TaxID=168475 RepID=UPI0025451AD7|nr:uncharacterized protein N7495_006997 [Penicillium taxi]KAJ5895306.1 hypothetical protein N7495_006997 [Penicillium taxi]
MPALTTLQQNITQQDFDENVQDLHILWGDMDANFSWEGTFPLGSGIPNELITFADFDGSDITPPDMSCPPSGMSTGETQPESLNSDDEASLCNYQLPSLQHTDDFASQDQDIENTSQNPEFCLERSATCELGYPWRINKEDYQVILGNIGAISHLIPGAFSLPSKYVFCRYIEGFFTGSHGHLPFLHFPTISVACLTPPLILAILAMGAQYRFERERAVCFYKASKALIDHHTEHSTRSRSHLHSHALSEKDNIEILQARIILTTLGIWDSQELLHDSLTTTSQIALYLRDSGLLTQDDPINDGTWGDWIRQEGRRRTKFIAYMLCNNQTIIYHMPPKILNSELNSLNLPCPDELWMASSASEWKTLRSKWLYGVSFGDKFAQLFRSKASYKDNSSLSSFGNLVLIHGIFQQIYLAWESAFYLPASENQSSLPHEVLTRFHSALRRWQKSWEISSDPSITPSSPKGPLGFNATAIFRIACIRLHLNLGPHRSLGTWDPKTIASAFLNAPKPAQVPLVYHAVLQSIHALSIPVRLGIEYVARTQTLTWSTIHSLCNIECALFLCKWLETLAEDPTNLHRDERRLLRIIMSVLREADLAQPLGDELKIGSTQIRRVGAMLIRLLSEILKGSHVFEMMHVFCEALRIYSYTLESQTEK